jgi:hypothetical protein
VHKNITLTYNNIEGLTEEQLKKTYIASIDGNKLKYNKTYRKGDVVTNGTSIYMATEDNITGTFDATHWQKVADKQIGPIAVVAGSTVCTGRWHNTVTANGFLVDDESFFMPSR